LVGSGAASVVCGNGRRAGIVLRSRRDLGIVAAGRRAWESVFGLILTPAFYVICRWIAIKASRCQPPARPQEQPAE
jgi:hypothetical protein